MEQNIMRLPKVEMEATIFTEMLSELKSLRAQVSALKPQETCAPSKADSLNELFAALAKAQSEMQIAALDSENPYFKSKYADLASIVKASRPALTKNGLSVIQQILPNDDGQNILHTILCHSSGQWIESRMRILPSKPDVQSLISYVTYIRRAAYAALMGVVTGDEDDDGERAVAESRDTYAKGVALNTGYNPKNESYESVSKDQLDELEYELAEFPDIAEQILESMKIQSIADLPRSKYSASIKRIREIKQIRSGK